MTKWRQIFESRKSTPDVDEMKYNIKPPASSEQLAEVEAKLGIQLPADVRELLSEFNGNAAVYPNADYEVGLYFSTQDLLEEVPDFIEEWEDEELDEFASNCVFLCHENGMSELYAVVVNDFKDLHSGEIVQVDHEMVGFGSDQFCEKAYSNLESWYVTDQGILKEHQRTLCKQNYDKNSSNTYCGGLHLCECCVLFG